MLDAAGTVLDSDDAPWRTATDAGRLLQIQSALADLVALDPDHMSVALAGIDAVSTAFPDRLQIAVFDTAFHATLSEAAAGYGLPTEWMERWGLRRFGFHGLSVAYAVARTRALLGHCRRG